MNPPDLDKLLIWFQNPCFMFLAFKMFNRFHYLLQMSGWWWRNPLRTRWSRLPCTYRHLPRRPWRSPGGRGSTASRPGPCSPCVARRSMKSACHCGTWNGKKMFWILRPGNNPIKLLLYLVQNYLTHLDWY